MAPIRPSDSAPGLMGRRSERGVLDRFVDAVRAGEGRALVMRGEPGVGKTALLEYLIGRAAGCRVARAVGVQSEMELAFAGLHQLCAPMLAHAGSLPAPQREALRIALGLAAGPAPDRLLVGLAVLGLLSEAAAAGPLVCVVDDEQWLDRASAQALGFAARRLGADPVGVVFAARVPGQDVAGLPELVVEGLALGDARVLLESVLSGPLDARVREQIIADTHGNPLALLELPRELTPVQLAGGFGLLGTQLGAGPLDGRIEDSFARQLETMPAQARRLVQLAAADPSGDAALVWRAAGRLGIGLEAAPAAAGLAEFSARVQFRHPLVRSAAYRSASMSAMREMHGALAEATDPGIDPDRRAWHRARAVPGPDEDVAAELERSAGRAQARGGLAAAAAFLERAALLTPEPGRRARRMLAAARATREAGAPEAALGLLAQAAAGPPDELQAAQMEYLRGQVAYDQRRGHDAVRLLLSAARLLEPLDTALARETHLEALTAAVFVGEEFMPGGVRKAAEAARAAPPAADAPRPVDVVLDAYALLLTEGHVVAGPALRRALDVLVALDADTSDGRHWLFLAGGRAGITIAMDLCDWESMQTLAAGQARAARDVGALVQLRTAMIFLAATHIMRGELGAAARFIDEERLIADVTGTPPVSYAAMMLAAWRGREQEATELIEATVREAATRDQGFSAGFADCAAAVLYNAQGRYGDARDAARRVLEHQVVGLGAFAAPELAEAAARTGEVALVRTALAWLSERIQVTPTEWALGMQARARALHTGDEAGYLESIEQLARTGGRVQLARSHLVYGEWLSRENRRLDARAQLRTAYDMLADIGADGFAERARRELQAIGDTVRRRTAETVSDLTEQEVHIARLAVDGGTNAEIGAQLFLSARTVEWHLRKVYTKLGVRSRRELGQALATGGRLPGARVPGQGRSLARRAAWACEGGLGPSNHGPFGAIEDHFLPNGTWYHFHATEMPLMEYLVTMTTHVPEGTPERAVDDVRGREAARSRELAAQGHLLRLWRPPLRSGEWRTLGLFAAADDSQMEQVLASMPLRVWRTDEVTPLSPHPNDPSLGAGAPGSEFLTTFVLAVPEGTPGRAIEEAEAREAERAKELAGQGHLRRLWTLPGQGRALGLWQAVGPAEMQAILRSLPLDPWMTVQTTALTPHPSDPAQTS